MVIRVWASVVIRIITRQRIGQKDVGSGKKEAKKYIPSLIKNSIARPKSSLCITVAGKKKQKQNKTRQVLISSEPFVVTRVILGKA